MVQIADPRVHGVLPPTPLLGSPGKEGWTLGGLFHSVFSTIAPDYDRSQWLNEKFTLGLDFPNVGAGAWGDVGSEGSLLQLLPLLTGFRIWCFVLSLSASRLSSLASWKLCAPAHLSYFTMECNVYHEPGSVVPVSTSVLAERGGLRGAWC